MIHHNHSTDLAGHSVGYSHLFFNKHYYVVAERLLKASICPNWQEKETTYRKRLWKVDRRIISPSSPNKSNFKMSPK